jgi:hypothetical protein
MNEFQQLPLDAGWRRFWVRSFWFLVKIVEVAFGAVYKPASRYRYKWETRLRLPPGTFVEQTEHPWPAPKGPWKVRYWCEDTDDYCLELPDGSSFQRRKDRDRKETALYVYPRYVHILPNQKELRRKFNIWGDYLLEPLDGSKFKLWKDSEVESDSLFVYPEYIRKLRQ